MVSEAQAPAATHERACSVKSDTPRVALPRKHAPWSLARLLDPLTAMAIDFGLRWAGAALARGVRGEAADFYCGCRMQRFPCAGVAWHLCRRHILQGRTICRAFATQTGFCTARVLDTRVSANPRQFLTRADSRALAH